MSGASEDPRPDIFAQLAQTYHQLQRLEPITPVRPPEEPQIHIPISTHGVYYSGVVDNRNNDMAVGSQGQGGSEKTEKKRRRPALSCEQCRKRKIKCDRNAPCNHCMKSKIPDCSYAPTHVPASRAKKGPAATSVETSPQGHYQPGALRSIQPTTGSRSQSPYEASHLLSEFIRPGETLPRMVSSESTSVPSTAGSRTSANASRASQVEALMLKVQQLEEKLASAVSIRDDDDTPQVGPGKVILQSREGGSGDQAPGKGIVSKTRYFGQSHWMNGADLFPLELGLMSTAEAEKNEVYVAFAKCKCLGRKIKQNRLKPLSTTNLGELIPSRDIADQLVNIYVRTFEGVLRILHLPTFYAEYERYWQKPEAATDVFKIQMQVCMAIGSCMQDERYPRRSLAMRWLYEAQLWMMLPPEKSKMTIPGLQIMCLVVIAKSVCAVGQDLTWITTGALLRTAMYMGLHRDPSRLAKMSLFRAELRRRLWDTILELNLQSSFDAGGSPLMSHSECDTLPPKNLNDDELTDADDDPNHPAHDPGDLTQMTVTMALAASRDLRTTLLKHVNTISSKTSYNDTLRLNSELTKACRTMSQTLTALSKQNSQQGPQISSFHINVAEMFMYRCYNSLHQPVMGKSLEDPRYYFSRQMCLDSALKMAHVCGLTGTPVQYPVPNVGMLNSTSLPRDSDFCRLLINGGGMFRNIPAQAIMTIAIALVYHRDEQQSVSLGYLPSLSDANLRGCLEAALGFWTERILSGETNVKGCALASLCIAHFDALNAGVADDQLRAAMIQGVLDAVEQTWRVMQTLAELEGVAVDNSGFADSEMAGMMTSTEDDWMSAMPWADGTDMSWTRFAQGPFDSMSPLFPGEF